MPWDLSCRDWEDRLRDGQSLVPTLPLWQDEAKRAIEVFNRLKLPDVIGTPTFGEAGGAWFLDIVAALFGSLDPATQARVIREVFLLVPKKNNKTTGGAGLLLAAALLARRPRSPFQFIGPTQSIADQAFSQALGMVLADPELKKRIYVQEHLKKLTVIATGATLQVKTFDTKIQTGGRTIGTLIDELHLLGEMLNASRVLGQIRGGMMPFPEAFLVMITTQSELPPAGVFKTELENARAVRDGRAEGALLPVLYEMPERLLTSNAWKDPAHWAAVNPNVGRSVFVQRLIEDYAKAREKDEGELRRWASQHLNIEIGLALRSDRWEGAEFWESTVEPELTFESLLERCDVIVFGIDGGGLDDLLGLCALGRDKITRDWLAWSHAWAHQSVFDRRKEIADRLHDFEDEGTLTVVATPGDDVIAVADLISRADEAGLLPEKQAIGVDPAGISEIVDELTDRGITVEAERIIGIRQGWTLSSTIKTTARRLAAGTLRHAETKLMNWCLGNAKTEAKGNAVLITKQVSGSAKIDPLIGIFAAVALLARNPEARGRSIYDVLADVEGTAPATVAAAQADPDIDMAVLADPRHPRFDEMRDRWERRHLSMAEEDG